MPRRVLVLFATLFLSLSLIPAVAAQESPDATSESSIVNAAPDAEPAGGASRAEKGSSASGFAGGTSPTGLWFVRLADEPAATYDGGKAGFAPASVEGEEFDADSPEAQAYSNELESEQAAVVAELERRIGREPAVPFSYTLALNAFAAELSSEEAAIAAEIDGVVSVRPDFLRELQTDAGPEWVGAEGVWDGSATGDPGTEGEGVIAGIIDSGISPSNPSFADVVPVEAGGDGYDHTNPFGADNYVGVCSDTPMPVDPSQAVNNPPDETFGCNDKLIGAWNFVPGSGTLGARDDNGHGSHTGSTTAGNQITVTVSSPDGATTREVAIEGVAPHANIISYRVCGIPFGGSCSGAAIVAAINQSIDDGVDTINYSIGSTSPGNPWADEDALAFLAARAAGIFVANSAGNAGPNPGTIGSPSGTPWMTTVGASEHNRLYRQDLVDLSGGDATPPGDLVGKGFSGSVGPLPIVYAGDFNGNTLCLEEDFLPGTDFSGQIVVCDRGITGRVQKSEVVAAFGADGFVLANDEPSAASLNSDAYAVPGVHVTYEDGLVLKAWLASGEGHTGSITATLADTASPYADMQASFSSRSPNGNADTIAPDVTAPGVDIIAALGFATLAEPEPTVHGFLSGTSMSSPHVSGTGVLLTALHPDWTPAETESALMLTARTERRNPPEGTPTGEPLLKEDNETPADPFDYGAGYVDVSLAARTGLLMDETQAGYLAEDPAEGGDPRQINKASMSNRECLQTCSWERTFEATDAVAGVLWTVTFEAEDGIVLSTDTPTFTLLNPGDTQAMTITADVTAATNDAQLFGRMILTPSDPAIPTASLPVAVVPTAGILPELIEIDTRRNQGSEEHDGFQTVAIADLQVEISGFGIGDITEGSLEQDPTNADPYDEGGTFSTTVEVPAGATRLVAEIFASSAPDMDLFVGSGSEPSLATELCRGTTATAIEYCELTDPEPGTYWVLVQNWQASAPPPAQDTFSLSVGVAAEDAGNMDVTGPQTQPAETPYSVRVFWDEPTMEEGDRLYGTFTLGSSAASPDDIGAVPVNLLRVEDDVTKTADVETAEPGDTVTYEIEVLPNVLNEDLNYTITDQIPDGMTYVDGSATIDGEGTVAVDPATQTLSAELLMPSPEGADRDYALSTSETDPACATAILGGGFFDLRTAGILPQSGIEGDTVVYNAFSGNPFNFYGEDYPLLSFTDDGFVIFDPEDNYAGPGDTPWIPQALPDPTLPNNVAAALWHDLEIVYDGSLPPAERRGVALATAGPDVVLLGYYGIQHFGEPEGPRYDFEIYMTRSVNDAPGAYEIAFAYNNLTDFLGEDFTVGVENALGTQAQALVNNTDPTGTLTDDTVVCFDYVGPTFDASTITYQVTVDEDVPGGTVLTNNVEHVTDNPGDATMTTSTDVTVADTAVEEPIVTVEAARDAQRRPPQNGGFLYTRTGDATEELTVTVRYGGTARSGVDYQRLPNQVTFEAGEATATQPVRPLNGRPGQDNLSLSVTLSERPGYQVGDPGSARIFIR